MRSGASRRLFAGMPEIPGRQERLLLRFMATGKLPLPISRKDEIAGRLMEIGRFLARSETYVNAQIDHAIDNMIQGYVRVIVDFSLDFIDQASEQSFGAGGLKFENKAAHLSPGSEDFDPLALVTELRRLVHVIPGRFLKSRNEKKAPRELAHVEAFLSSPRANDLIGKSIQESLR
jgi:hypothetical protein